MTLAARIKRLTGVDILALLSGVAVTFVDSLKIIGSGDATKGLRFEVDAQTTGKTLVLDTGAQTVDRTLAVPVLGGNRTLAVIDQAQTFTADQTISALLGVGASPSPLAQVTIGSGGGPSGTVQIVSFVNFTSTSGATSALRGAQYSIATPAAAMTCAEATAFLLGNNAAGAGSAITRSQGVWASVQSGGANNVGILHSNSLTYVGNWFIYDESVYPSRFGGAVTIASAAASTDTTSGALIVGGGIGAGGSGYFGSNLVSNAVSFANTGFDAYGVGGYFKVTGANGFFSISGAGGSRPAGCTYGFYAKSGVGIAYVSSNNGAIDFEDQSGNVLLATRAPAAGQTGLLLFDFDNGTVERVTVGAADSGGAGFKVLRIPN